MEMLIYSTAVCTLVNLVLLGYVLRLRRKVAKSQKAVRHLSRSIQKLNSKNGHLWYQLAQSKSGNFDGQENTATGLTVTKI